MDWIVSMFRDFESVTIPAGMPIVKADEAVFSVSGSLTAAVYNDKTKLI
ncbi:MAG: hypothetical protein WCT27_04500 [Patescibacteria group bacterium]|jgi:hypothetical protein